MRVVYGYASEVTTEEARALASALDDAGVKREPGVYALAYSGKAPGPTGNTFSITFEPILPNGQSICSSCG
jgi:hypothetical protein